LFDTFKEKCAFHGMVSIRADCISSEGRVGWGLHAVPCAYSLAAGQKDGILLAATGISTKRLQDEGRYEPLLDVSRNSAVRSLIIHKSYWTLSVEDLNHRIIKFYLLTYLLSYFQIPNFLKLSSSTELHMKMRTPALRNVECLNRMLAAIT